MKPKLLLVFAFISLTLNVVAQLPLYGTWELVSGKGTDPEGKSFSFDNSTFRETKIITPTHFMFIQQDVKGDSLIFKRSFAGNVSLKGNNTYTETSTAVSEEGMENVSADLTWKVDGDKLIEAGTVTLPDGKKIILNELVFQRVNAANSYPKNPAIGTWDQLSSTYTREGKTESHTNATATRFHIITPTHWMRISHRDNKFENAMFGTYTLDKDKGTLDLQTASFPINKDDKFEYSQNVAGNKLYLSGRRTGTDGKLFSFDDKFQRASKKPNIVKSSSQ